MVDSYVGVIEAFRNAGLYVDDKGNQAFCQGPGHSGQDRSVSVTRTQGCTLIHSYAGDRTEDVLAAVGLTTADLYDNKRGVDYCYPDGRVVHRSVDKKFRQSGNTEGSALYRADRLPDLTVTVYVAEGEKDADALATVLGVPAVSAAMGAQNPSKADWSPLSGRPVVAVVDDDAPGQRWADQIRELVGPIAESLRFVKAKVGKDAADHVAAGYGVADFIPADPTPRGRRLTLVNADQVEIEKIQWWEPGLIPSGSLTLLAGRGNAGKSTAAAAWAAIETKRGGHVLWLHSEESRSRHVKPKLVAAGADCTKVHFLEVTEEGTDARLSLPDDLPALRDLMSDNQIRFLVLDAVTSFKAGNKSGDKQDEIRPFLEGLNRLADDLGAVVLGIAHFNKGTGREARLLVTGSTAWTDVPRSVLGFARDDSTGGGVITDVKGNLVAVPRSLTYSFVTVTVPVGDDATEVGRVVFGEDTTTTVDDLLNRSRDEGSDEDDSPRGWLSRFLKNGPQPAGNVYAVGGEAGYSDRQLRNAHRNVCGRPENMKSFVKREPGSTTGPWVWRLPSQEWPWDKSTEDDAIDDKKPLYANLSNLYNLAGQKGFSDVIFEKNEDDIDAIDDITQETGHLGCHLPIDEPIPLIPVDLCECGDPAVENETLCLNCQLGGK
ncbi:AAA family ATPase [Gordonia amicalis]|uniref:AAA family ATPase n=1 Tax=Gordonia amicalis TaxID=89053 RepID=UPI0024B9EDB9|nr:AAA family ATPase [Gordonia amicalis]MDJ0455479.1 AAA family ATPase [Gordonia amicalis]MDV7078943.1 AAA family ATPase [Gordonia amicalis]